MGKFDQRDVYANYVWIHRQKRSIYDVDVGYNEVRRIIEEDRLLVSNRGNILSETNYIFAKLI
ncbi:hypothetical protein C5S30_02940 [ANME-1 cluster archaeon GoMg4]|nr:hypothetical protein [ANME-1 cluster archaeon GoMg4]